MSNLIHFVFAKIHINTSLFGLPFGFIRAACSVDIGSQTFGNFKLIDIHHELHMGGETKRFFLIVVKFTGDCAVAPTGNLRFDDQ